MHRFPSLSAGTTLLLATFASFAVACSAPDASEEASSSDALTERKIVEVESFVSGTAEYGTAAGQEAFRRACDAWTAKQRELLGPKLIDVRCGDGENLTPTSNTTLFGGLVKARLLVTVEAGTAPRTSRTKLVTGEAEYGLADSLASWQKACAAEAQRAKDLFGPRFVFASCKKPSNLTPTSNTQLQGGDVEVVTLPALGKPASLAATIRGTAEYGLADAQRAFQKACDAWAAQARAVAGDRLAAVECGTPENLTPTANTILLGATGRLEVTSGDATKDLVESAGLFASSAAEYGLADASTSLEKSCTKLAASMKDLLGERLVASSCDAPVNLTPTANTTVLRAPLRMLVAPPSAGATTLDVTSWVPGTAEYGMADADAALGKAVQKEVASHVERSGAPRIVSMALAEPKNLTPTANTTVLGAPLTVKIALPADGLPPLTSTDRVRGEPDYGVAAALESWQKACSTAIAKARQDQGERFLAAACSEPSAEPNGNRLSYASDVTVWLLLP